MSLADLECPAPGELVDDVEAARRLGTSPKTLRNWRAQRKGPRFRKIGTKLVRYQVSDLAAFIAGESLNEDLRRAA